jgi:hypothetical protein
LRGPIFDLDWGLGDSGLDCGVDCGLRLADFGDRANGTIYNRAKSKSKITKPSRPSQSPISIINQQSRSPIDDQTNPHSPISNPQCILSL